MLKKTLLAAAVFACATTAVQANEVSGYLTGSVGQSESKDFRSDTDFAYKVAVGLQANPYVGLEAQYTDLGKPSDKGLVVDNFGNLYNAKATAKTRGLGANLVGTLPLDDFKLFAKVGYHKMETKVRVKVAGVGSGSAKEREWVPSFGAGASYAIMPELEIVAEYERYKDVADAYNVDLASVGLRYNF